MGGMQVGMRNMTMQGMQRPGQPVYNAQGQPIPAPRPIPQSAQQMQQGTQQSSSETPRSISGSAPPPPQASSIFVTLYDYEAQNDSQMSFMKGEQISAILTSGKANWYQATSLTDPSIAGWVPSNFLVELKAAVTSQAPPQRQVPAAPGAQQRGYDQHPGNPQSAFQQVSHSGSSNSASNSGRFPADTFSGALNNTSGSAARIGSGGARYGGVEECEW